MTPNATIVEKIKKLLALAGNNNNENEAQSAAAKVQALLQEYNLSMAEVQFNHAKSGPAQPIDLGKREKTTHSKSAMYKYQRDLMQALAKNNFCMTWIEKKWKDDPRGRKLGDNGQGVRQVDCHILLGREENVTATQVTYDYLIETMDRLLPYQGMQKRGKEALLWLAGCTERLVERLDNLRREKEEESRVRTSAASASAVGSKSMALVILRDVYSNEEDLNHDARFGYEPGTTAARRKEREAMWKKEAELVKGGLSHHDAYYVARGLPIPERVAVAKVEEKPETDAQRRKREEKEARDHARWRQQHWRKQAKEEEKRNHPAYQQGKAKGADIGLDDQVK